MAEQIASESGVAGRARLAEEQLRRAAHIGNRGILQNDFTVPDMHCAGCLSKIETALNALPFVDRARANLSTRRVSVFWHAEQGSATEISNALTLAGYANMPFDLADLHDTAGSAVLRRLLMSLAVSGFAAANIMLLSISVWSGADAETAQLFHLISGLIAIPAVAYAGQPFFRSAVGALAARSLNMDVPISLAVLLALLMSIYESVSGGENAYFDASVMLLFFLLIGRTLDHFMREKARGAVTRLASFAAKGAGLVDTHGAVRFVPLGEIEPGMRLLVAAGERFPVDGVIASGRSDIDRSLVTGESASVSVCPDDRIEAGTLNLTGPVEIVASRTAEKSFLAEIIQMMEAAENGQARYVRIADRMAAIYAPAVHIAAALTFVGWLAFSGDWHISVYAAISVLIITCPCALGLAVPVVHVVGANRLFHDGIMIKDGAAFEKLGEATRVLLDKTGTLTLGRPSVLHSDGPVSDNSASIKALAIRSHHPAAHAVATHLDVTPAANVDRVTEVPGFGVEGVHDGRQIRLGRPDWVFEIASAAQDTSNGGSKVAFAVVGAPSVMFSLEDALRPDAAETIRLLQEAGYDPEILSGDAPSAVAAIARKLGIHHWAAGLTPEQKITQIRALQGEGEKVLMIGDGINDGPALALAHVSMAPASGSDIGRLAADLVFTRESLSAVPLAIAIARKASRLVTQNFTIAIAYNCIAVPLAVLGYVTPLIAAIAMSASSVIVVANSMRLGATGTISNGIENSKRSGRRGSKEPDAPGRAVAA